MKKLEIRDKWKIDLNEFKSKQKLHKFFNDHHDIKFVGDRDRCLQVHEIWKEDIKENRRKAKEKFKEEHGAMTKDMKYKFRLSLRDELKRIYIEILQREDMKPNVFVKEHKDMSDDHQYVLYDNFDQWVKLYETHQKVEHTDPVDEHPGETLRQYIADRSTDTPEFDCLYKVIEAGHERILR